MNSPIKDVSDTAYWIAHYRAQESERPDALFRDPLAASFAGDRGRKIAEAMPATRIVGWSVVLRTRIIDDYIAFAIVAGIDTVLNLGAGLDARPYRMSLPATLQWIEADYPRLIDYKERLAEGHALHCQLQRVRIDLADRTARLQLLQRVNAQANKVLVITEGVIPYLSNDEVGSLAEDLAAMARLQFWVVDFFTEQALKIRRRGRTGRSMQNAPFKFAPGDWFGFFRQHGWVVNQMRYYADEADRLRRPIPLSPYLRLRYLISHFWLSPAQRRERRKFAGYALLERRAGS
ncbi:MAG: class I SAM-dependent methyltransferase [Steroidobacteraceae bacterium]